MSFHSIGVCLVKSECRKSSENPTLVNVYIGHKALDTPELVPDNFGTTFLVSLLLVFYFNVAVCITYYCAESNNTGLDIQSRPLLKYSMVLGHWYERRSESHSSLRNVYSK